MPSLALSHSTSSSHEDLQICLRDADGVQDADVPHAARRREDEIAGIRDADRTDGTCGRGKQEMRPRTRRARTASAPLENLVRLRRAHAWGDDKHEPRRVPCAVQDGLARDRQVGRPVRILPGVEVARVVREARGGDLETDAVALPEDRPGVAERNRIFVFLPGSINSGGRFAPLRKLARTIRSRTYWALLHTILCLPDICAAMETKNGEATGRGYVAWAR